MTSLTFIIWTKAFETFFKISWSKFLKPSWIIQCLRTLKHSYTTSPRTCVFGACWHLTTLAEVKQLCLNTMIRAIMNESHINYLSCGSRGLVREENGKHRQGRERMSALSMRFPHRKASLCLITTLLTALGWPLTLWRHTSCHWIVCPVW